MSDSQSAIQELQAQVENCRKRWEPIIEDSIGVTWGGYRDHNTYCRRCRHILAALKLIAELRAGLAEVLEEMK